MRAFPLFLPAPVALALAPAVNAYGSDAGQAGKKGARQVVVTREDGSSSVLRKIRAACGMSGRGTS